MAKYYSLDLRQKALLMVEKGKSAKLVAQELEISKSAIYEWIRKHKMGNLASRKPGPKQSWKVDQDKVLKYVDLNKDAYLREIAAEFNLSAVGVYKILRKSGITLKKNKLVPSKESQTQTGLPDWDNGHP